MRDATVKFSDDDFAMGFAIEEAQQSLIIFFDAFVSPKKNQESFLLKIKLENSKTVEHIWVADINASALPLIQGTVANETNFPNIEFMQRVEFQLSQVTDWMFIEDGFLVGGYTIQVIRSQLNAHDRAMYDANAPYKFKN